MNRIGSKLKKLRHDLGLTQKEMAADVISVSFYSKVERGFHDIGAEELIQILEKHGISFQEFFSGMNDKEDNKNKVNQLTNKLIKFANEDNDVEIAKVISELRNVEPKSAFLESMILQAEVISNTHDEKSLKKLTNEEKKRLKKMIFQKDTDENQYLRIVMITNVLQIYDFEEATFLVKNIIRRYQDVNNIQENILVALSALMVNYIDWGIKKGRVDQCYQPIQYLNSLPSNIELAFSKILGKYYEDLINHNKTEAIEIQNILIKSGFKTYVKRMAK